MSDKERKELIVRMLNEISNSEYLKKIFDYVHMFFIKRAGG